MAFSREFRILLAEILLLSFIVGPVLAADYEDDFEDYIPPAQPAGDFYTFTSSGTGQVRTTTSIALNSISLLIEDTSVGEEIEAKFDSNEVGWDLCNGGVLSFAIYYENFGGGSGSTVQLVSNAGGFQNSELQVSSTGALTTRFGELSDSSWNTFALNTWYNVSMQMSGCDNGGSESLTVYVSELDDSSTVTDASVLCLGCNGQRIRFAGFGVASLPKFRVDNVRLIGVNEQPGFAPLTSVAVTSLGGFDVDQTANNLIARTGGTCTDGGGVANNCIRIYDPGSLAERANRDTNCLDGDMVAASDIGVVYVYCNDADGDREIFTIRGPNNEVLFDPSYPAPFDCDPNDECLDDINFETQCSFEDENFLKEINDLKSIPLDYTYDTNAVGDVGDNSRAFAVAYSTTNGYVGVFEYTTKDGNDGCNEERRQFAGDVRQISVWQPNPSSDITYIAAVTFGAPTKVYAFEPSLPNEVGAELDGTLSPGTSLGPLSGTSISCALTYCLISYEIGSEDRVTLINIANGANVWPSPGYKVVTGGSQVRGVSLTQPSVGDDLNDLFAAWTDPINVNLAYASNGTVFGTLGLPEGDPFYDVEISTGAVHCWTAHTSKIAYWPCADLFAEIEFTCLSGASCDPLDPGPTDGGSELFGDSSNRLVEGGTFANAGLANMFMGVLMVAGMTVTLGFSPQVVTKGRAEFNSRLFLVLGVIGALLGFVLAIAFGLFSTAVWVSIVILAAIAIGVKVWLSRANGGG